MSSAQPRSRTACALLLALAACLMLAAGASAARKPKPKPHKQGGCGSYCKQAGLAGAGPPVPGAPPPPPPSNPVRFSGHTLRVSGGAVDVRLRCALKVSCVGALVIFDRDGPVAKAGGVNLRVAAGKLASVRVPLSSDAKALLARAPRHRAAADVEAMQGGCGADGCTTTGSSSHAFELVG
jgi:hypothetical protein